MKRSTLLSCSFSLGIGLAGVAGCVSSDADSGLRILRNVAPSAGCAVEVETTAFIPSGTIDAQSLFGYFFTPIVSNDLVLREGETNVAKTIFIEGAEVSIHFYDDELFPRASFDPALIDFIAPLSGSIEPSGGVATFGFEIVPTGLLQEMSSTIGEEPAGFRTVLDVQVLMYGTRGGGRVESNVFRYPVEVCVGCRVTNVGLCSDLTSDYVPLAGSPCNPLQDGFLECCTTDTGAQLCPAQAPPGT